MYPIREVCIQELPPSPITKQIYLGSQICQRWLVCKDCRRSAISVGLATPKHTATYAYIDILVHFECECVSLISYYHRPICANRLKQDV